MRILLGVNAMLNSKAISGLLLCVGCVLSSWSQAAVVAGISVSDLTNPYFVTMVRSLRDELQTTFGDDVRLLVRSSAYDHPRQVRQLEEFVAEKVDVIFLVASDEHKIGPAVKRVVSQGTPIFAIDVRASGATATITTDNVQAGQIACEGLASGLNDHGNILIINGPQVSSVIERVEGCKQALKNHPDILIVSDTLNGTASIEGGLESMAYALQAYPKIDGIFAINDRTALGAEQAIVQANANTLIMSVDGSPAAREALIQQRKGWLGTATQFPDTMSKEAVRIAKQWLENKDHLSESKSAEKTREAQIDTEVLIPTKLMTPSNALSFTAW